MHLDETINSGIEFIKAQLIKGDYGLSCTNKENNPKFSDNKGHLFSLFFMLRALYPSNFNEIERTIILTRVFSEESNGQWGYSPRGYYKEDSYNPFFVDADDTSFALRILRQLGVYRSPEILVNYLAQWNNRGAAFITFIASNKENNQIATQPSYENNFCLHPEVNANVFHTLLDGKFDKHINDDFISACQNQDGFWEGYFYPNHFYATWQYMHLLARLNKTNDNRFKSGVQFIVQSQQNDGSWGDPFSTALALSILNLCSNYQDLKSKARDYLIVAQQKSGSWYFEGIVWHFIDQEEDNWIARDKNKVVTTSLCVEALKNIKST